jgi:hypothetical protein
MQRAENAKGRKNRSIWANDDTNSGYADLLAMQVTRNR